MVLAIALFSLFIGCASKHNVTLTFDVYVGAEPLEFGKSYHSPNGDGTYSINDFKLYVSNVRPEQHDLPGLAQQRPGPFL